MTARKQPCGALRERRLHALIPVRPGEDPKDEEGLIQNGETEDKEEMSVQGKDSEDEDEGDSDCVGTIADVSDERSEGRASVGRRSPKTPATAEREEKKERGMNTQPATTRTTTTATHDEYPACPRSAAPAPSR